MQFNLTISLFLFRTEENTQVLLDWFTLQLCSDFRVSLEPVPGPSTRSVILISAPVYKRQINK